MTALLEVDGIGRGFGAVRAVDALRFEVGEGEIVGLIGPNGAGKTTAINLISGSLRPDIGVVRFAGEVVTGMATHLLAARGLARTFQSTNVYGDRSVRTNVMRGAFRLLYRGVWASVLDTKAQRARRVAVGERVDLLLGTLGLAAVASDLAGSLSYGQQKTLGLAIALAGEPRMVLLDEPAAGLSAEEADRIASVIEQVRAGGVSVVVVDHNMRFIARLCDRIVVMHHGAELCVGTPEEIRVHRLVIEAYLGVAHESA